MPQYRRHRIAGLAAALCAGMLCLPTHAQFAVIDVASVTQLVQQVQTLSQQLLTARAQLVQAQTLYASMTGNRGMQGLLGSPAPNYLPTNWLQLVTAMQGSPGAYGALAGSVTAAQGSNAVLTGAQLSALSPGAQAAIGAARAAAALLQGLSSQALANSSAQFSTLQGLLPAVGSTNDQKSVLELQAAIGAEQTLLQNQQTKLEVLYQAAQSQQWAAEQQRREQSIVAQGDFATRFEPSPP